MESIPPIEGFLKYSIADITCAKFIGYGNLPNLVPDNCGLFLGVAIAAIPEAKTPSFQLSFGDKFNNNIGDLVFMFANFIASDPDESLRFIVCLEESVCLNWLSPKADTDPVQPQPSEWCIIPYADLIATNAPPTFPVAIGNIFPSLMDFQRACSIFIEASVELRASKLRAYANMFFLREHDIIDEGSSDSVGASDGEISAAADEGMIGDGDSVAAALATNDGVTAAPKKRSRRTRMDPNVQGDRRSSRAAKPIAGFQMPPAPTGKGKGNGKDKLDKGGKGGGSKSKNSSGDSKSNLKQDKPAVSSSKKRSGSQIKAEPKTDNLFTTPVQMKQQTSHGAEAFYSHGAEAFSSHLGKQKETLDYNTQVMDRALDFAERWFHRYGLYHTE